MAIAVESSAVAGNGSTNQATLTIAKPTGVVEDDFLVCILCTGDSDSDNTMTTLAGWTAIDGYFGDDFNGVNAGLGTYYKVAGSSEPTNYTWTQSRNMRFEGCIMRLSGVDNASPINTSSMDWQTAWDTNITAPSCTPTNDDGLLIAAIVMASDSAFTSSPSGMTIVSEAMGADGITGAIAHETLTSSGATGVRTWVKSSTGRNSGSQIALNAAAGSSTSLIVDMENRKFTTITN
jgi:hypothetical protein